MHTPASWPTSRCACRRLPLHVCHANPVANTCQPLAVSLLPFSLAIDAPALVQGRERSIRSWAQSKGRAESASDDGAASSSTIVDSSAATELLYGPVLEPPAEPGAAPSPAVLAHSNEVSRGSADDGGEDVVDLTEPAVPAFGDWDVHVDEVDGTSASRQQVALAANAVQMQPAGGACEARRAAARHGADTALSPEAFHARIVAPEASAAGVPRPLRLWTRDVGELAAQSVPSQRHVTRLLRSLPLLQRYANGATLKVLLVALTALVDACVRAPFSHDKALSTLANALERCGSPLAPAVHRSERLSPLVREAVHLMAEDATLYTDGERVARGARVQSAFLQPAPDFWASLEREGAAALTGAHVSRVLHHAARLRFISTATLISANLWRALDIVIADRAVEMTLDELSTSVWACAKLGHTPRTELLTCLVAAEWPQAELAQWSPSQIVNLTWACGKKQLRPPRVSQQALLAALARLLPQLAPQVQLPAMWALGRVRSPSPALACSPKPATKRAACRYNLEVAPCQFARAALPPRRCETAPRWRCACANRPGHVSAVRGRLRKLPRTPSAT